MIKYTLTCLKICVLVYKLLRIKVALCNKNRLQQSLPINLRTFVVPYLQVSGSATIVPTLFLVWVCKKKKKKKKKI